MALLDALRALSSFDPPRALPPCDLDALLAVIDAHGLAPLASYHVETRLIGAGLPDAFRERLLAIYQGVVNDNVFKLVTLKAALRESEVPVVLLGAAAYLDWLYPHLAFRPVGDPRLLLRGEDGERFAAEVAPEFKPSGTGAGAHTATFTSGQFDILVQEGLVAGRGEDHGLFARREPFPAIGPAVSRPALEDALLVTVADLAQQGLYAALLEYVDLRELVRRAGAEPARAALVRERAATAGLDRALFGALAVLVHYFPDVTREAEALRPELGRAEQAAVHAVVEQARDPEKLRVLRGAEAAARAVVGPR
jgi:Uncharacterised nucleotidyltransferase